MTRPLDPYLLAVAAAVLLVANLLWGWLGLLANSSTFLLLAGVVDMAQSLVTGLLIGVTLAQRRKRRPS
jgi:hypothetical protein